MARLRHGRSLALVFQALLENKTKRGKNKKETRLRRGSSLALVFLGLKRQLVWRFESIDSLPHPRHEVVQGLNAIARRFAEAPCRQPDEEKKN
jgi:hypothetical protein